MVTQDDIEVFLNRLSHEGASYKEVQQGLWIVRPGGAMEFDIVVHHSPPVVVLRVKVMELPKDAKQLAGLSRRLLELNTDLLHGSYGIEQNSNSIVLTEALELEHLDFEEFLAAFESIVLALASHLREIGSLGKAATPATKSDGKKRAPASSRAKNTTKKKSASGAGSRRNGGRSRRGRR